MAPRSKNERKPVAPKRSIKKERKQADISNTAAALARAFSAKNAKAAAEKEGASANKKPAAPKDVVLQRVENAAKALRPGVAHEKIGRLPCRDVEYGQILNHLRSAVVNGGTSQVLYVSGMPGTGKTACINKTFQELLSEPDTPGFIPVEINAMRLGTPNACFGEIYRKLHNHESNCGLSAAYGELSKFFTERKATDAVVMLVIDEIDHLITRNQAVLYKVFDWLTLPDARLVVTAISNTMDLPERLLPRVASRFDIIRVDFAPYRREQMVQILRELLATHSAIEAFDPAALELCAARVAGRTGDIRKALQLCRRAVEVAYSKTEVKEVSTNDLQVAERDVLRESAARAVPGLGIKARRFLAAMVLELRQRDAERVPLQVVTQRYTKLLTLDEAPAIVTPMKVDNDEDDDDGWGFKKQRLEEEVRHIIRRLVACRILCKYEQLQGVSMAVSLGLGECLELEDLVGALSDAEESDVVSHLLRDKM
eukprot:CAMPEP_0206456636 /NCGR_PEP_ID=MMETSP0324_2-20121206/22486_1 /ASSEMBLY_ACC=CAM_ASM_000836 /TAXON_ID=2866 /ORGANISM="Crypthecodinium cohnii, Strain Seligo" /LENGTH=483 /DNA_ID=CAMNT_0053927609 /DNA_START=56 /DNA_END=1507 /DNA_ORIENTATION=+